MNAKIMLLPGDGIGPEVVAEARRVLDATAARFGHTFDYHQGLIGGGANLGKDVLFEVYETHASGPQK